MPLDSHSEDNPPLIQYWDDPAMPDYIADLVATFDGRNPDMRHLLFNERTAGDFIAEHFGERHLAAFRACAVPAMQADYFRYCAVYKLGGLYADADFLCLRPLRGLLEDGNGHLFEHPNGPVLNGLFAFRSPGHSLLAMAIEVATGNIECRSYASVAMATGPAIFSGLLRLYEAGSLEALRALAPGWEAASLDKAVEEHGPISRAFEGVRVAGRAEMLTWVQIPAAELAYKSEPSYWANHRGSIYRDSTADIPR